MTSSFLCTLRSFSRAGRNLGFPLLLGAAGWPRPESAADYSIEARLIPDSALVRGTMEVTFFPAYTADTLWLHLYANAFRDPRTEFAADLESWGDYSFERAMTEEYGWIGLAGWTMEGSPVTVIVDETLGFIPLPAPVQPGDTVELSGSFTVKVPVIWSRMGHDGDHYEMSQWYPKMCVLDDRGWHLGGYRSEGEFFGDFGDYSVALCLPDSFVTAATGSRDTSWVSADSTWRTEIWSAGPVHDFCWAADPQFELLEHNFRYPDSLGGGWVRVHAAVRSEDTSEWEDAAQIADSTMLYYGEWYGPYPYADLWMVQSATWGGMEYPQLVMIGRWDSPFMRYSELVLMHEIGHQWFYGVLGSDELDEAWLDEGINSFSELRYFDRRYGTTGNMVELPSWISGLSDTDLAVVDLVSLTSDPSEIPVLTPTTETAGGLYDYGALYYSKPALFMRMLQQQMGAGAFDRMMHLYYERFSFHHPRTEDLEAIAEEVTGGSWEGVFDPWLRDTVSFDMEVLSLRYQGDSTVITTESTLPHAVTVDVRASGTLSTIELSGGVESTLLPGRLRSVELDPDMRVPDCRPWNNSLPRRGSWRPMLFPLDEPDLFITRLTPLPGWSGGGLELGLACFTRAMPVSSGGPWELAACWKARPGGGEGFRAISFDTGCERRRNVSDRVRAGISLGYGMESVTLEIGRMISGDRPSDPVWDLAASLSYNSVSDTAYYGSEVTPGHGAEVSVSAQRMMRNAYGALLLSGGAAASPSWNGRGWASLELELDVTRYLPFCITSTRLFSGIASAGTPAQELFRPGGGRFPAGLEGWLLPPDGLLSAGGHYLDRSGPAMSGYGSGADRTALVLGEELGVEGFPVFVFGDAGWVRGAFSDLDRSSLLCDAGVGLDLAFARAWFPFWTRDGFDMRWRLRMDVFWDT